jgi:raffinose/stachyose/melibiose transport system substrate-binding protein
MKREYILNGIGIALLAVCFMAAVARVLTRTVHDRDPARVTIRFSHWQLEGGIRDAFDAVAAVYMKRHPNVTIEQIPVPGRVYGAWIKTRLAGEQPPDLMELSRAVSDEDLARYFVPLTAELEQPNPYNAGSVLAGKLWRETFLDGLVGAAGTDTLQEYYGIPCAGVTVRMYYNRALYREIMGHERTPSNYAEFLDVCARTRDYASRTGQVVLPVAGSRFNANVLLDQLFRSQTQKLALSIDRLHLLKPPSDPCLAFLDDRVTLDSPAIRSGLRLMHEVGRDFQAGFLQLDRDDAIFYFSQGHALMIATGNWDYGSILKQSAFPIGIFGVPLPTAEESEFVLGPVSEAGQGVGVNFHLTTRSAHPEVAVDFLKFLTSVEGNQIFCNVSKWLPAVGGVTPVEESKPFVPIEEGYPDGFRIAPIMWGSGEMYRVMGTHLHKLVNRDGGVDAFVEAMRPELPAAVKSDARQLLKTYRDNTVRLDTTIAARRQLGQADKVSGLMESQNQQESAYYWLQSRIKE